METSEYRGIKDCSPKENIIFSKLPLQGGNFDEKVWGFYHC
jgi:hypothetical protein